MAESLIAYTDCIDARTEHEETLLLTVTNEHDYAGIVYEGLGIEFSVRFHGRLFEPRFPEEDESEEESDGTVDDLGNEIYSQQLLEVEPAPGYFHHILKLALKHNVKSIGGTYFSKGKEAYEMEKLHDKNPLQKGKIWLTVKDGEFFTNTYGEV